MKFPNYSQYEAPKVALLEAYAEFSAHNEVYGRFTGDKTADSHMLRLRHAGELIGQGCFNLMNRQNAQQAKGQFKGAKQSAKEIADTKQLPNATRARARLAWLTAHMLEMRNQPATIDQARADQHDTVMNSLTLNQKRLRTLNSLGHQADVRGKIGELTALALLTRYKHPWMIATAALEHQDRSQHKATNFDLLAVVTSPYEERIDGYKIQVKTECFGLCSHACYHRSDPVRVSNYYNDDITLVSGCCDLDLGSNTESGLSTIDMLRREHTGMAKPDVIRRLDHLTNNLLFNISSDDERRQGQITPNDTYAYPGLS